jgi:dinuclear metal center YbgI/SA1388 family protein
VSTASHIAVSDLIAAIEARYPPHTAESWDRVGLVVGDPGTAVTRVLLAVDCVPETVAEAVAAGAEFMLVHHPLLLRGVHSVATTSYRGELVHRLIRAGVALYVAHTNADAAVPGVSDALAARLGLVDVQPLGDGQAHPVRVGRLEEPATLAEFTARVAARLPATAGGVRAAGAPDRVVRTVAVAGGAGDDFLDQVTAAGADAYLTSDLRHHPASEHLAAGGPALIDVAHWAGERPWLDDAAAALHTDLAAGSDAPLQTIVSDLVTDVWTAHAAMSQHVDKGARL